MIQKRLLDIVASASALLLLSPVLLVLWFAIRRRMGSPVVFRQQRGGLGNRPFLFYKFRTMSDSRDANGELLPDRIRLTALENTWEKLLV